MSTGEWVAVAIAIWFFLSVLTVVGAWIVNCFMEDDVEMTVMQYVRIFFLWPFMLLLGWWTDFREGRRLSETAAP